MKKRLYIILLLFLPIFLIGQPGIKYKGNGYVADSTTAFGKPVAQYTVIIDEETGNQWLLEVPGTAVMTIETATKTPVGGNVTVNPTDLSFDSDRVVLRGYAADNNIKGTTVNDFLEYIYFKPPVMSIAFSPTLILYEIGTTTSITVSGTVVNYGATLSNGYLYVRSETPDFAMDEFTSTTSYSGVVQFDPVESGSGKYAESFYSFQARQDWVKGAESDSAYSTLKTLTAVYPYFHLVSAVDYTGASGTTIYSNFTKVVEAEGTKSVVFNGTGFSYICVPDTWSALTAAVDHNGFDVFSSYTGTAVTVTAVFGGVMVNVYTDIGYTLYKIATPGTYSSVTYTFTF